MFSTRILLLRAPPRTPCQIIYSTARRSYGTDYDQRTKRTLETSSKLTWLTAIAAAGAAAVYYTTNANDTSSPSPNAPSHDVSSATLPGHRHESAYASDVPKPVEDRHGDSVAKHSIAAHKNQSKVREGKFSDKEFDNHVQVHSPGKPGGDFEKR